MPRRRPAAAAVVVVALVACAAPIHAQKPAPTLGGCDPSGPTPAFLSPENEVFYGCDALFKAVTPQGASATGRFQAALGSRPNDPLILYLLGTALAAQGKGDSARVVLRRALQLDPSVEGTLAPRFAERPALRELVADVLANRAPSAARPAPPTPVGAPAPAAPPKPAPAAPAPGPIVLGAYACTADHWEGPPAARTWKSEPRGSIELRADGTYRRDGGAPGRFRYDQGTGVVTWVGGGVAAMQPERTTFRRNVRTAQIDLTLKGDFGWSCGINLP